MERNIQLTLYKVNFNDNENFMFDYGFKTGYVLNEYLSKVDTKLVINNFQYLKDINALYTSIKIKFDQDAIFVMNKFPYNYLAVFDNINDKTNYFFIVGRRWISENCIELQLKNDVLNNYIYNRSYTLDRFKTRVNREMQTRLKIYNSVGDDITLERELSTIKEGLNPKLYRREGLDETFNDEASIFSSTFYLVYISKTDEGEANKIPVECFLASKSPITLQSLNDGGIIIPVGGFEKGEYYYLPNWYSEGSSIIPFNYRYKKGQESGTIPANPPYDMFTLVYLGDDNKIHVKVLNYATPLVGSGSFTGYSYELDDITSLLASPNVVGMYKTNNLTTNENEIFNGELVALEPSGDYSPIYVQSIYNNPNFKLDDSRLLKIIEIPYSPLVVRELLLPGTHPHTGKFFYDESTWSYDQTTGFLKLINLNSPLERIITFKTSLFDDLRIYTTKSFLKASSKRNLLFESKLFTSEFYYKKASYDSFSFIFELENVNEIPEDTINNKVFYKVTSTINSRFMFRFDDYNLKYAPEDYSNVLVIARNNEVTIYNNAYVNYVRTGYNYDVKARDRSNAQTIANFALSLAPTPGLTKTGKFSIAKTLQGVYGNSFSVAQNINNTINTIEANNDSFNRKQSEMQAQATSVYGSDDLDLMTAYTGVGKMKLYTYICTDEVRELVANLFYFTGYTANRFGLPNIDNRKYFDYFSIEPIFKYTGILTTDLLNELIAKMKEGVTIIHKQFIEEHSDFNFDFENWESDIYEEINK